MKCKICKGPEAMALYHTMKLCRRCYQRQRIMDKLVREEEKRLQRSLRLKKEVELNESLEI